MWKCKYEKKLFEKLGVEMIETIKVIEKKTYEK